ncbi:hypothetical protein BDZ94DRAFT_1258927 [Collybia nuda]|uniref:Uncharacterized protein n=1 Tax=Collybia nuda TaxID=64659 RepID=A0A9P6CEY4_9AGAR|nr:hypothetical protein BDZ94DRAFT_1258927 [Collybia nuda]
MDGYLAVFVINGVMIAGILVCLCCYGCRNRKERDIELGNKGGLSRGSVEYVVLRDRSTSLAWSRSSLQPQRRTGLDDQENIATENMEEPIRQPTPTPTPNISEVRVRVSHALEENVAEPRRPSLDPGVDGWALNAAAGPSNPQLSMTISEANRRSRASTTSLGPTELSVIPIRSTHRRTVSASTESTQPSTTYLDSIYLGSVSTLPSYPGTARSTSPPAYSDLSRTRSGRTTRASSRVISGYTDVELATGPMPDFGRLQ